MAMAGFACRGCRVARTHRHLRRHLLLALGSHSVLSSGNIDRSIGFADVHGMIRHPMLSRRRLECCF